jgi:hypothetical protein
MKTTRKGIVAKRQNKQEKGKTKKKSKMIDCGKIKS